VVYVVPTASGDAAHHPRRNAADAGSRHDEKF
jgi:hypothetical protein